VVVHSYDAGDDRVAGAIQDLNARRGLSRRSRSHGLNLAVRDDHQLVFHCRRARSIDHSHVIKDDHRRVYTSELSDITFLLRLGNCDCDRRNKQ